MYGAAQRDCEQNLSRMLWCAFSEPSSEPFDLELVDMADECEDEDGGSVLNDEVRVYACLTYVFELLTNQ